MYSSSSSYSSWMLPTISSRMSSMVTIPAVCPYSSTTMDMWIFFDCISPKRSSRLLVSGIKWAARRRPGTSLSGRPAHSAPLSSVTASMSLICKMPMISSMSSPYTGYLELPASLTTYCSASLKVMSPSRAFTAVRWVMMSPACLLSSSKMLVIISASLASRTPFSCPSFTMSMISSSVTSSSWRLSSTPKHFNTAQESPAASQAKGLRRMLTARTSG